MTSDEFKNAVHKEAIEFRRKKVKEIIDKGDQASEIELIMIQQWAKTYGNDAW